MAGSPRSTGRSNRWGSKWSPSTRRWGSTTSSPWSRLPTRRRWPRSRSSSARAGRCPARLWRRSRPRTWLLRCSAPTLKVLVVGGGGREHAIVKALRRSPQVTDVLCAPGNAGIAGDAECLPGVAADDAAALVAAAKSHGVDLVAIGPEAGLVAGAVDACEEAG